MGHIFVTRAIPENGIRLLVEAGHTVDVSEKDGVLTREEFLAALSAKEYDAVLCLLTDTINDEAFAAVPTAKIFANYAVGFDNIDVPAASARNVIVTNTPGVLTDAVAEHTFALLTALARRIPESDMFTRAGKYEGWGPLMFLGSALKGKTVGILGAGRIGSRVLEIAVKGYGMKATYYDIKRSEQLEKETGAEFRETPEALVSDADFVSVHVPLLPATRHLVDKTLLSKMKKSSYLINTSRGPVVDEGALVGALQMGVIRGAALDVFENEPALAPGLAALPNVIVTPHTASATTEAREEMARIAAENIIAVLSGKEPITPIPNKKS